MRCDEGYRCDVCGRDVESITESDLYLRYLLGEVPLDQLHRLPERHIRCNPAIAQYIVTSEFASVVCDGSFSKHSLDHEFVKSEEARVTAAWNRLQQIPSLGIPITEYPETKT